MAKNSSQKTAEDKKIQLNIKKKKQVAKRNDVKDEKIKKAAKKFFEEMSKKIESTEVKQIPYQDRVSRIEKYQSDRFKQKVFTMQHFTEERYDVTLEWCYICHRTLFTKQATVLRKCKLKSETAIPDNYKDEMPEKVILCHRCKNVLSCTKKVPAQSFWNSLYPGDIPDELKSLTSMEVRMIQRMIPFMKIVKYQGRFGQYGLQGQAVLFARDVTEVLDILPRKPNSMDLIMVVESLKNIERQREMIINKNRLQKALNWLLEFNERYKDVKIDCAALQNLNVDYSQICVVAPPKANNQVLDAWKTLDIPRVSSSSVVKTLQCKHHDLSAIFNEHAGQQSLSMCMSSLIRASLKNISTWDRIDLDMVLEEGHSLHIASIKETSCNTVTFDTILRCFSLFDESIEIALIDKVIFKRDRVYEFVESCFNNYGFGVIFTNKVYISIIKYDEEFYFFDARPRGLKGYACTKNKKEEYNGSAIVMRFNNFNHFIKRLESQFKANNSTEYTMASVIISQPTNPLFVSTFGDNTLSLHTNPIFKQTPDNLDQTKDDVKTLIECTPDINLTNFVERLTLDKFPTVYASHCQADIRYDANYRNIQCTANSCAAIIKSLLVPLNNWTTSTMDEVLHSGNDLYIETCDKLRSIRFIAPEEIVTNTKKFGRNITLEISWHTAAATDKNMKTKIEAYFDNYTNGILTSQGKSYAIMSYDGHFWFFDSHYNSPHGKAVLHRTDLDGLMEILYNGENAKICGQGARYDISHVKVIFTEQEDIVANSRLDYVGNGKHLLADEPKPNETFKKVKVVDNFSKIFDFEHGCYKTPTKMHDDNYIDDFESIIDENEHMTPYRQLYDTRIMTENDTAYRFFVTPWKADPDNVNSDETYKQLLNLFDHDNNETEYDDPSFPTEMLVGSKEPQCYVTTASCSDNYRELAQLKGFDIVACIAANLHLTIDSFSGWSTKRLQNVLDEANNILSSFEYKNDTLSIFGATFQFDRFFYGEAAIADVNELMQSFFEIHEYGLLHYNDKQYSVAFLNRYYFLFDPHSCSSNGYPSKNGTSCIFITKHFDTLIELIGDRASYDDKAFQNEERFIIQAMQVETINDTNIVQKEVIKAKKHPKTPEVEIDTSLFEHEIDCPISLMRPIDLVIPKPEDMFDVNADNKDLNSENIPLISIKRATKPPLSHKLNKRFEEYCFPVLFPRGINGLNEERQLKMTALDYFQSRVMGKDSRFHSKEYLLFALNYVENDKVAKNISVCGKIQKNHQNISNVASNLHLVMRTIRGTSAYWGNALLDLLAMVKVLGPGTAFLTLSCNDLNWDFMLKAALQAEGRADINPINLSLQEKQRLVENNPVLVSRIFNREVQNMLKLLKNGQAFKNGNEKWIVTDHWYRIEWQQRGSPHCHMIVWIKDFPKLDSPEGIKAMESLCRCDIPEDDEDLANMVKRYQRHHCTATCYKTRYVPTKENDDDKQQEKSKSCRFSFPRPVCKETKVLDPETTEFIKNGHRLVRMKRNQDAKYINNYNANILRIWQANMDIQFITSQAIVAYVAKYSCKSEPSSLHKLVNEAIRDAEKNNEETKKTLFKVTMKILNERQVSCCEAATRLCHLPMKGSSRTVVFINTSRPEERYRMLNVQSNNPQNNTYFSNIIDRYELRPDELEEMSLAEFAMEYQTYYKKKNDDVVIDEENGDCEFIEDENLISNAKIIKLKDGKGYIKKRTRSAVFRSRYFSLIDNRSNYFYGLLLLHLPFRSEKQLLEKLRTNNGDPIERYAEDATDLAFFEKRHLLRPFNNSCTVDDYLQYSLELQDAIRQMEVLMNGENSTPEEDNNDEQNNTVQDDIRDVNPKDVPQNLPSADLLNSDQKKVFKLVQEWIKAVHRNEKVNQILLFTTGVGGTGKSFLIAQIIRIVKDYFEPKYANSRVLFAAAPTGIAALTINGQTLHSALSLGIELGEVSRYKPLTGNYLKQKRELWKNVQLLIIDEISMVSYEMFKNIDLRLKELMSNDSLFGGINVLVFGDLLQLPPVRGHNIYERPKYTSELHLWRLFDFFELDIVMRTKDKEFIELQKAMRIGQLKHKHRQMLLQRVESATLKREGIFDDLNVTMIAPVISTVEEHNANALQKLISKNYENEKEKYHRDPSYQGYYLIRAIDELQVKTNDTDWEKFIPKDDNKCAGIPKEIKLAVGARVMLRRNIDVAQKLVNGALGNVKSFNWGGCFLKDQSESGDLPESVIITFDKGGDREIKPTRCEFKANGGRGLVDRLQLPLILAWAVTAHKLQSATIEKAVLDLGPTIFEKGQGYVMVGRVSSLEGILILRNLDVTKFEKTYVNQKAIEEMKRLNKLQPANWHAFLQPRELSDSRYKLV